MVVVIASPDVTTPPGELMYTKFPSSDDPKKRKEKKKKKNKPKKKKNRRKKKKETPPPPPPPPPLGLQEQKLGRRQASTAVSTGPVPNMIRSFKSYEKMSRRAHRGLVCSTPPRHKFM